MANIKRTYTLSDDKLALFASNLVVTMERDASELEARGVTADDILSFKAMKTAFMNFLSDDSYLGMILSEVDKKKMLRAELIELIQIVSGFFEQTYGLRSADYRQLKIAGLQNFSEDSLITAARRVVANASDNLPELLAAGLTQLMIDALQSKGDAYEDSANETLRLKRLRAEKTIERIEKGNELFSFVKKYCAIGKLVWEHQNFALWNDYLIYQGRSKKYRKDNAKSLDD